MELLLPAHKTNKSKDRMNKNYTNNAGYQISQPPQYMTPRDFERASKNRTKPFEALLTPQEGEAIDASGMEGWEALMLGVELGGGLTQAELMLMREAAREQALSMSVLIKKAVGQYLQIHQDRH